MGVIRFPDSMSNAEIEEALKEQFSKVRLTGELAPTKKEPFIPPSMTPVPSSETMVPAGELFPRTTRTEPSPDTSESDAAVDAYMKDREGWLPPRATGYFTPDEPVRPEDEVKLSAQAEIDKRTAAARKIIFDAMRDGVRITDAEISSLMDVPVDMVESNVDEEHRMEMDRRKKIAEQEILKAFGQGRRMSESELSDLIKEQERLDSLPPPESGLYGQAAMGTFAGTYGGVAGVLKGIGAVTAMGFPGNFMAPPGAYIPKEVQDIQRRMAERTPKEIVQAVKENPFTLLGQSVEEYWSETVPRSESEKRTFTSQTFEGAARMAPYFLARAGAPWLIGAESLADHIINDSEELQKKGMSEDDAAKAAIGRGFASGALQASVFQFLPKQLRKTGEKFIVGRVGEAGLARFMAKRAASVAETSALFEASNVAETLVSGGGLKGLEESFLPTLASGAIFGLFSPYHSVSEPVAQVRKRLAQGTLNLRVLSRLPIEGGKERAVIKTATGEYTLEDTPEAINKLAERSTPEASPEERARRVKLIEESLKRSGYDFSILQTPIPGWPNRVAQVGDKKKIVVSEPRLHDYLELYIGKDVPIEKAIDQIVAHESVHSALKLIDGGDMLAVQYWDHRLSSIEKQIMTYLLLGKRPSKPGLAQDQYDARAASSLDMGHEAIRFNLELAGGLRASEWLNLTKFQRAGRRSLYALAEIVSWVRQHAYGIKGTKASAHQRELLDQIQSNIEAAKKGATDASKVTETTTVHGDVRTQRPSASGVPVQEGIPRVQPQTQGRVSVEGQKEILLTPQKTRDPVLLKNLPVVEDVPPGSIDPQTLIPAIRLVNGDVVHGWVKKNGKVATHPEIARFYGIDEKEWDRKGFVDRAGTKFYGRVPAAKGTKLPTKKKAGELHSTDQPKIEKKVAPTVQPAEPPKAAQATGKATIPGAATPVGPAISTATPQTQITQAKGEFDAFKQQLSAKVAAGGKRTLADIQRYRQLMEAAAAEEVARMEQQRQAAGGQTLPKEPAEPPVPQMAPPAGEGSVEGAVGLEMLEPPDAKILVFHGEGADAGAGKGETWYTTNFARALHFGGKISYLRLTPEEAKRFQQPIKTDFKLDAETLRRSRTLDRTFKQRVDDLDAVGMEMRDSESELPVYTLAEWRRYQELGDTMKNSPDMPAKLAAWGEREKLKNTHGGESPAQMLWSPEKLSRWESGQTSVGMAMEQTPEQIKADLDQVRDHLKMSVKGVPVTDEQIEKAAKKIASLDSLEKRQIALSRFDDQVQVWRNNEAARQLMGVAQTLEQSGRAGEAEAALERATVEERRAIEAAARGKDPAQIAAENESKVVSVIRRFLNLPVEPVPAKPSQAQVSKWRKWREELHIKEPYELELEQKFSAYKVRFTVPEYQRIRNALQDQIVGDPAIKTEIIRHHYENEVPSFLEFASSETIQGLLKGYHLSGRVLGPIAEPDIGRAWTKADQEKTLTQLAAGIPETELRRFAIARGIDVSKPEWIEQSRGIIVSNLKKEARHYAQATAVSQPEVTRKEGGVTFVTGMRGMLPEEFKIFQEGQRRGLQREWERGFEKARNNRAKAIALLMERMLAGVRADERSPMRNALSLEDLFTNVHTILGVYSEFTPEEGSDYKWLTANLDEEAAGTPASTHRITLLENRETHDIEAVATYRELRSKEIMLYDPDRKPGDRRGNYYRLGDVIRFFQVRGTILVRDPVNRFHQRWSSSKEMPGWAVFKQEFGNDAELKGSSRDWAALHQRYEREKLWGHKRARAERFSLTDNERTLLERLQKRYEEDPARMPPTGMRKLEILRQMQEESQKVEEQMAKKQGTSEFLGDENSEKEAAWGELELSDAMNRFERLAEIYESEELPSVQDRIRETEPFVEPEIEPIRDPLSIGRRSIWELHKLEFVKDTLSTAEVGAMARFFNEHKIRKPDDVRIALEKMEARSRIIDPKTKLARGWRGRDFCVASFLDKVFSRTVKEVITTHGIAKELYDFAKGNNRQKKAYLSIREARPDFYKELRQMAYEQTLDLVYEIAQQGRRTEKAFPRAKDYNEQQVTSALLGTYGDTFRRDLEQLAISEKRAAEFLQRGLQPGETRFGRAGTPEPVQPELFAGFRLGEPSPPGVSRRDVTTLRETAPTQVRLDQIQDLEIARRAEEKARQIAAESGEPYEQWLARFSRHMPPEGPTMEQMQQLSRLTPQEQAALGMRPRIGEGKLLMTGEYVPGKPEKGLQPMAGITLGEVASTGRRKRSPFPRPALPTERLYPGGVPPYTGKEFSPGGPVAPEGYRPTRGGQYMMESILQEASPNWRYVQTKVIPQVMKNRAPGEKNPLGLDMSDTMIGVARRYTDELQSRGLFVVNRDGQNTVSPEESLSIPEWFQVGDRLRELGANPEALMRFAEKMTAQGMPGSLGTKEQAVLRSYIHELFQVAEEVRQDHPIGTPEYKEVADYLGSFLGRFQRQVSHERGVQLGLLGGTFDIETGSYESMRRKAESDKDEPLDSGEDAELRTFADRIGKARKRRQRAMRAVDKLIPDPSSQLSPEQKALADKTVADMDSWADIAVKEAEFQKRHGKPGPAMAMGAEEVGSGAPLSQADMDYLSRKGGKLMLLLSRRGEFDEVTWRKAMMKDFGTVIVTDNNLSALFVESERIRDSYLLYKLGISDATGPAKKSLTLKKVDAETSKIFVLRAIELDPRGKDISTPEAFHTWNYLKQTYVHAERPEGGRYSFEEIIAKAAVDLGVPSERLYKSITTKKSFRRLTTEAYNRLRDERAVINQARNWMAALKYPKFYRWTRFTPRIFFTLKVAGHTLVPMITHASPMIFNPWSWKSYLNGWKDMYAMTFNKNYHIRRMLELQHHPQYREAVEAGLEVNPFIFTDDYMIANIRQWFGKKAPDFLSGRGFDALKTLRMDQYMAVRNATPVPLRTKEMFKLIAQSVNAATGIVHTKNPVPDLFYWTFFAPKLTLSQWNWLFGQPLKAAAILIRGGKSTEVQRRWAASELTQKAVIVGLYAAMLALNDGFLKAIGSDQSVNFWNPRRSDFWQFKVAGFRVGVTSPIIGLVRFIADMIHIGHGQKNRWERSEGRLERAQEREASYLHTRFSPFAAFASGIVTGEDYQGRKLPYPLNVDPRTRSDILKGKKKYSWPEYGASVIAPIPVEELIREVWKDMGADELTVTKMFRALGTASFMAATGARASEDIYAGRD